MPFRRGRPSVPVPGQAAGTGASMNRVYAWFPGRGNAGRCNAGRGNAGHASLDISLGRGPGLAEYVSWWPGSPARAETGPAAGCPQGGPDTYLDDVAAQGREADEEVEVACLDEEGMRACWLDLAWNGTCRLLFRNSAHTVAEVLLAGGARLSPGCLAYAGRRVFWAPAEALTLARLVNGDAGVIRRGLAAGLVTAPPALLPASTTAGEGVRSGREA